MGSNFLDESDAVEYLASKCSDPEGFAALKKLSVIKAFPGKPYIAFTQTVNSVKVNGIFRVNVISMDRGGLCIMLKEHMMDMHIRIGYIPTKLQFGSKKVFLSIPPRCNVERTLRRTQDGSIAESLALGLLIKQEHDRYAGFPDSREGSLMFSGYEEFKDKTKREIPELEARLHG